MPPVPKKVRIRETGQVFFSAQKAANAIGGDKSTIHACLRGTRHKHKGYTFEQVKDDHA